MRICPACQSGLEAKQLSCPGCQLVLEGRFRFPRLARLSPASLSLAENLLLCGGNLKELGQQLDLSYPTVRKKVDELIAELRRLKTEDAASIGVILGKIERKEISAEEGTRLIKEINNEL